MNVCAARGVDANAKFGKVFGSGLGVEVVARRDVLSGRYGGIQIGKERVNAALTKGNLESQRKL